MPPPSPSSPPPFPVSTCAVYFFLSLSSPSFLRTATMRILRQSLFALLCIGALLFAASPALAKKQDGPCTIRDSKNRLYDLSPLTLTNGTDWLASTALSPHHNYTYYINVCHDVHFKGFKNETFSKPVSKGTGVVQVSNTNPLQQEDCGMTDYVPSVVEGILTLIYENGNICKSSGQKRQTIINFECDPTIGLGRPVFLFENTCHYLFDWKSSAACPVDNSLSGWAIFFIVLACLSVVYGLLYLNNTKRRGLRGTDAIPGYPIYIGFCETFGIGEHATAATRRRRKVNRDGITTTSGPVGTVTSANAAEFLDDLDEVFEDADLEALDHGEDLVEHGNAMPIREDEGF
ncbi:hypothetical protein H696_03885 [Fonticula alba]|uniref:Autophagy-related protein 27 n=1 Tax=Fonticula alba TaxID=691883 RepID=A0A058Z5U2_FONAL|nr:hypothetical protein H696_03885 [Fonticula alba]KCV69456.1 hypothetical protein H696_03885 [Fonticula alba]|eukprot:XP_009496021.1 hypothetical protein H696_03885 [Fonticula alba]